MQMKIMKILRWITISIFLIYLVIFTIGFIYESFFIYPRNLTLPTALFFLLIGALVILLYPSVKSITKKVSRVIAILSLVSLFIGSAYDVYLRNNLEAKIQSMEDLRMGDYTDSIALAEKDKQNIVKAIEKERFDINWGATFENLLFGYNKCRCGRGSGILTKDDRFIFSTKHNNDEMLFNGFLCFKLSLNFWEPIKKGITR